MEFTIVGFFETYGAAEAAVTDLEMAGIVGEQVEMISDTDEDTRTADTPGEPSTKFHEPSHSRIARIFGADESPESQKVRDISGDQPDYIGDQEFYANHVKQGGAVLIVRPSERRIRKSCRRDSSRPRCANPREKGWPRDQP